MKVVAEKIPFPRPNQNGQNRDFGKLSKACHVLIVDDKQDNLLILKTLLERAGATTDSAKNGEYAVELCNSESYDLIMMDLAMPVLNGLEATEIIRRETPNSSTPIIAVTADVSQHVKENCIKVGMNGYISKPLYPNNLLQEIERVLSEAS
ncbi:response regulator [Coraliomargarita algicola]|uniref:Response regulator n=1 Tax=Coraliomargarita algicola TaxID=3092156 RepID=A0ABZ0RIE4_9BACT|nr:response regulator [Coraliomargarita sp. J2-16]WPJ94868.1 response regulator [Coraliomargarita sp. J2-16]